MFWLCLFSKDAAKGLALYDGAAAAAAVARTANENASRRTIRISIVIKREGKGWEKY
jgi:hypothetical protein